MVEAQLSSRNEIVEFGRFRLYPHSRKLFHLGDEVPLGGRAMDILLALARHRGEIVTKEELYSAAWPNVFVHESNLKVTIASLRRTLRQFAPGNDHITTVVGRGYWLAAETQQEAGHAGAGLPVIAGARLPEPGLVIGREEEIAALKAIVADHRLTTIAGPGGIGKTTVAVAVAKIFQENDVEVAFIDLARVVSEEFVASSIAAALGISASNEDSLQAIVSILGRRPLLLLLDTCEHVLNAVTHFCEVVLAKSPDVKIMATSRQILRARHEKVVWLTPLEVPPPNHTDTAETILKYAAPRLLAARAAETTDYRVSDSDAQAIAKICRQLDGAPLAIELVSSRLANRTPVRVLDELEDRFRVLRQVKPGGPLRHQTLLVTLEWSYALLSGDEARVLRAASIFAGPFDADAAARVVAHHGLDPVEVFDAIGGLRAKSMLSVDQTDGELHFRLLDSTRAFAGDLLDSHGELADVATNHARLQLECLARTTTEHAAMPARKRHVLFANLVNELRKAIDWTLHHANEPLLGVRLVAAGIPLWHELSLGEETRKNCQRALEELDRRGHVDLSLKLRLVVGLASVSSYLAGDPLKKVALFETAVELARKAGDPLAECRALGALATYWLLPGNDNIIRTLEQMRQAAERAQDPFATREEAQLRAQCEIRVGDFAAAHARLTRLAGEIRDVPEGTVPRFQIYQRLNVNVMRAAMGWLVGKPATALRTANDAFRDATEIDHGLTLIHCLAHGIVWTTIQCGEYDMLRRCVETFTRAIYRHGMAAWIPVSSCYEAIADALTGDRNDPESLRAAFVELSGGMEQLRHDARYSLLAQAMLAIGQHRDADEVIRRILASSTDPWGLPEVLRLRAAVERADGRDETAEATLRDALLVTDDVNCPSWKLRVSNDLAALLLDHDCAEEAGAILTPAFRLFDEGFDTRDLRQAQVLLRRVNSASPRTGAD